MPRWVNTRVVIDIETGQVLEREGFLYEGPWALATNVTTPVPLSNEGMYWVEVRTVASPGVGGIDLLGGGHGAAVTPYAALPVCPGNGAFGQRALANGTRTLTLFAPAGWGDSWVPGLDDVPPAQNFTLTADPGSYAISGVAAALLAGYKLSAAAGSYSLTGVAATLTHGYSMTAAAGSYAVTGATAALLAGYKLAAAAGAYSVAGNTAALLAGRKIAAAAGSYAWAGAPAGLLAGRRVAADAGSYSWTGVAAGLLAGRKLSAVAGSYSLTGIAAALTGGGGGSAAARWVVADITVRPQIAAQVALGVQLGTGDVSLTPQHRMRDLKLRGGD